MDCMMPVMDGFAATRLIRAREGGGSARTPIIACTASVSQDEYRKCLEAGMDDFLSKPYRPESLKGMIEKWGYPSR
jgi:CheY-like chemotaxis protein